MALNFPADPASVNNVYTASNGVTYVFSSANGWTAQAAEGAVPGLQQVTDTSNTTTNNILIGGDLPATPNINLDATGYIKVKSFVTSNRTGARASNQKP